MLQRRLDDILELLNDPDKSLKRTDLDSLERRIMVQTRELAAKHQALRDAEAERVRLKERVNELEAELNALRIKRRNTD